MKVLLVAFVLMANCSSAQKLVNAMMVDSHSKFTEKVDSAVYLVAVKKYSDTSFERVEYHFEGPRLRSIFYSDPEMKIKQGVSRVYNDSGTTILYGSYLNNKKSGKWHDLVKKETLEYESDVLISTMPFVVRDTTKMVNNTRTEIESAFRGGINSYTKFIGKNLAYPDRALKMRKEGTVVIEFSINTKGKPGEMGIYRSVEFSLDEEVLRLAAIMPEWIPASLNGAPVKSYKRQPVIFKIPADYRRN